MKSRKLKRHSKHLKKSRSKLATRKLGTRKLGTRKLGTRKLGNSRLHRLKTQHGGSVIPVRILEDINREAPSLDDTIKRLILKWNNNPNRSTSINKKDNGIIDIYLSLGNIHNKNRHIHVFNTIKIKQDGKKYIDWSLKLGWGQHRYKNKLMPLIPVYIVDDIEINEINEIMDNLIYNWIVKLFLESSEIKLRDYISDIPANYQTPIKVRPIVSENQEETNKKPMSSYENPENQEETTSMSNGFPVARSLFHDLHEAEVDKQHIMQQPVMQQPVMQQPVMQQPAIQQPAMQQPVLQSKQSRKRNKFRNFI